MFVAAIGLGLVTLLRPQVLTALLASTQSILVSAGVGLLLLLVWLALRRMGAASGVRIAVLGAMVVPLLAWGLLPFFRTVRVDEDLPAAAPAPAATPGTPVDTASEAPAAEPVDVASGTFEGRDGHAASGTARLVSVDGGTVVRLEDFAVTNGPDLRVVVAGGEVAKEGHDLGALKGNEGNQNYEVPADVDLAGVTTVLIWCRAFDVLFGAAALQ